MKAFALKSSSNALLARRHFRVIDIPVPGLATVPVTSTGYPVIQRKPLCPCDGGCPRCQGVIQPKLTVGQPDDIYEQEADRVAEQVMRLPEPGCPECPEKDKEESIQTKPLADQITPLVQRQVEPEEEKEEETIQPKEISGKTPAVSPGLESHIRSLKGGGQPLDPATRAFFEPRFGADFSGVRIHADTRADQVSHDLRAHAFTYDQDVFFRQGEYAPGSSQGKGLLAHELTHVVQQAGGRGELRIQKQESDKKGWKPVTDREKQLFLKARSLDKSGVFDNDTTDPNNWLFDIYATPICLNVTGQIGPGRLTWIGLNSFYDNVILFTNVDKLTVTEPESPPKTWFDWVVSILQFGLQSAVPEGGGIGLAGQASGMASKYLLASKISLLEKAGIKITQTKNGIFQARFANGRFASAIDVSAAISRLLGVQMIGTTVEGRFIYGIVEGISGSNFYSKPIFEEQEWGRSVGKFLEKAYEFLNVHTNGKVILV